MPDNVGLSVGALDDKSDIKFVIFDCENELFGTVIVPVNSGFCLGALEAIRDIRPSTSSTDTVEKLLYYLLLHPHWLDIGYYILHPYVF